MKCTNCHSELSDSAKFCPECGAKVNNAKYCSQCGTKLQPNVKFCPECGTIMGDCGQKELSNSVTETNSEANKIFTKLEDEASLSNPIPARGKTNYDLLRIINVIGSIFIAWGLVRFLISHWAVWLQWVIGICIVISLAAFFGDLINKKEEVENR